ncbi:MAG: zf-TFIIB domain-containing protein [Anaerolineae bacterium]|nr:zf-TFIIB domain-containing protein [Gloeobacterales cyanobacterium ES-bin-313]
MKCPRCTIYDLKTVKIEDLEVDQCEECLGIWCDIGEMKALVEQTNLGDLKITGKPGGLRTIVPLSCPRDGKTLVMIKDLKAADIEIDICPTCAGRWLDGGELDRLRQKGLLANVKNFFVTYLIS